MWDAHTRRMLLLWEKWQSETRGRIFKYCLADNLFYLINCRTYFKAYRNGMVLMAGSGVGLVYDCFFAGWTACHKRSMGSCLAKILFQWVFVNGHSVHRCVLYRRVSGGGCSDAFLYNRWDVTGTCGEPCFTKYQSAAWCASRTYGCASWRSVCKRCTSGDKGGGADWSETRWACIIGWCFIGRTGTVRYFRIDGREYAPYY